MASLPVAEPQGRVTACTLDCPDSCSLAVEVDGSGAPAALHGGPHNPLTGDFICSKVARFSRHYACEERIAEPLLRTGARGSRASFEPISWDDALDRIANRIADTRSRLGGEAILPLSYGGSNGKLTQDTVDALLWDRLQTSQLDRTVCAAPSSAALKALYDRMPGVALHDFHHSRLIVLWGVNPSATGIHLVPQIRKAQQKGARLVVVDPRRTPLANQADLVIQPLPGTDLPLALAVANELFRTGRADRQFLASHAQGAEAFEQACGQWPLTRAAETCAVPIEELQQLVDWYAESSPAVIRCGWGPERNRNGVGATAAILALPAIAGKFGVRGGGYTASNSGTWRNAALGAFAGERAQRVVNQNKVGRALLEFDDPPIDLLFVYNHNPLMTLPDQNRVRRGLERDDLFTVVFDQVFTDTARYADIVLPATTFLEHDDLASGYGAMQMHRTVPVVSRFGAARSNLEVFTALLERLDLLEPGDPVTAAELVERILGRDRARALADVGRVEPPDGENPVQFVDCMPHGDGRVHLQPTGDDWATVYDYRARPEHDEDLPLILISPAERKRISSTFGQLHRELARIGMHPEDASARGLTGSPTERVRVRNSFGEVRCGVRIDRRLRPGVAELPKGLWAHNVHGENTANALAPDSVTAIAGGACFNDCRVEVTAEG